jgi:hypothetical protein
VSDTYRRSGIGNVGTVPDEINAAAPRSLHRRPQRIALIAGAAVVAMAAAAAALFLTASPTTPYAAPGSVCTLVSPATVVKYLPGGAHGKSAEQNCVWPAGDSGALIVYASVLDNATQARTGFPQLIQRVNQANTNKGSTVTGMRAVTGLGDQAAATFQTSASSTHPGKRANVVFLFVRSRNAIFQVIRIGGDSAAARLSGPALLPGAIAIAREVMAAMTTLGPSSPGVSVNVTLDVRYPVNVVILGEPGRGDQHQGIAE